MGRENAGTSSEMGAGIPQAGYPRSPGSSRSSLGQSGPKARPQGAADGQQVDIPAPHAARTAGTHAHRACRERRHRCESGPKLK